MLDAVKPNHKHDAPY